MATWVYPPLPPKRLEQEADSALEKELEWLLRSLQDSLSSLREGLHECAALLAPKEPGSTLVLSSMRSESVKGFVTRVGTKIVKGDIQLRLSSLSSRAGPTTRLCMSNSPNAPELVLSQLVSVRDLVNQCLDIVDVSTWTGDPLDARFIYSQIHLLGETIAEGRQMLRGESDVVRGKWWETSASDSLFDPPLPPNLSFHLSIADSALVLYLRTLEPSTPTHTPTAFASDISLTGFSIRDRLFGPRQPAHDEVGDVFAWKGDDVKVREKVRVESQDPTDKDHLEVLPNVISVLVEKISTTEAEILELLDDLDLTDEYVGTARHHIEKLDEFDDALNDEFDNLDSDERVRLARLHFGETLPAGILNEEETLLYTRLYGEPIIRQEEELVEVEEEGVEEEVDLLLRDDGQGGWEEVPHDAVEIDNQEIPVVYDMEQGPPVAETATMQRAREVAEELGAEIDLEPLEDEEGEESAPRLHPLTLQAKASTDPATIYPPKDTLTGPISVILSEFSNKHIAEAAHKAFGGPLLPHSTRTPPAHAHEKQSPIPLEAKHRFMSEQEANAYIAVLYPGMYASVLSVLTEVRKRLGTDWIRSLITQEGGPNVLDAGAGGAGILAWRDVLHAEYGVMVPDHPPSEPYPLGRSTVLTGSDALRQRASIMLENTTFLPRLPDYLHVRAGPTRHDKREPQRKQFDIVIAPHTLLGIEEDHQRKAYVENLWQCVNPNGGVLILLEKGHQRGFEAIAGAREMLLKRYIASPDSTSYTNFTDSPEDLPRIQKQPGMIIAPCTNHQKCPMYAGEGPVKGRKDFCHFEQRYIRPPFHQRIISGKDRNHEDLKFSYLAVQRGVDLRETEGIVQGDEATDAAFRGYEHPSKPSKGLETETETTEATTTPPPTEQPKFHTLSLPRMVYIPMKRRGHVIFDMCTPAGKIERWTVPRSFSRQAYKDARKAHWGDLWALGAKTRIPRNLKIGNKDTETRKERLERRAAQRAEIKEMEEDETDGEPENSRKAPQIPATPPRKKGQRVPSWKKHAHTKKVRQASEKASRSLL
ncbi:Rogdi leucine zipper containing protein-domain-containing protein [Aspergillus pseudoustus]|uniref:Rogdi leucine zipper containing protein-domain-containing protein n=1 Tax=Aspergillus pseudoustus TaxID=1810923 RepID=A0ABR4IJA3_9EURO